jgi:hypothetical protein
MTLLRKDPGENKRISGYIFGSRHPLYGIGAQLTGTKRILEHLKEHKEASGYILEHLEASGSILEHPQASEVI